MRFRKISVFLSVIVVLSPSSAAVTATSASQILQGSNTTDPLCPDPYDMVGDQCLYFNLFSPGSQHEAGLTCRSLGGDLAAIRTATQFENIIDYIYSRGLDSKFFWIDGSDAVEEGSWKYSSGEPFVMATPFWLASESVHAPNGLDDENCVDISLSFSYFINDISCDLQRLPLCERNMGLKTEGSNAEEAQMSTACPLFYVDIAGSCLSFVTWQKVSWQKAREICIGLHGQLAYLDDIEQLRALYLYIEKRGISSHSFWTGGSDSAEEGNWIWINSEPVPTGSPWWGMYSNATTYDWYQEPDGDIEENCLGLTTEGLYYFRDKDCDILMTPLCRI